LELADAILSASFISMFGDPSKNSDDFARVPLGELAHVRSGVTKGRKLRGKETIRVPYLRVANVQDGFLGLSEVKTIEVLPQDVDKYHLEDGDILITEGGDPDKLRRGCVWRNQVEGCIHQNHVFRLRTKRGKLAPEYLAALLRTQYAKHHFLGCAKRTSNLASVNSRQVKAFPVPLQAITLQEKFVSVVEHWVQSTERLSRALADAENLFTSMMNDAFTGQLTAEWEAENAKWIAAQVELQEQLPLLLLLALIREKATRVARSSTRGAVPITALMKYVFLFQMEGSSRRRFYHFVPYHYGPFARELYTDLERLQAEGLINVDSETDEVKTRIALADPAKADAALAELPDDLKEDVATIIDAYGDLDHNALLKTIYDKYPTYTTKSRVKRRANLKKDLS
jgi:type I restriction enzyme S subunit